MNEQPEKRSDANSERAPANAGRPESKGSTELRNYTVLIRFASETVRAAGAGCLIDGRHILTCRQVIEAALSSNRIGRDRTVLISPANDPQKMLDAIIVRSGQSDSPENDLVLLRISDTQPPQPVEFATPLNYFDLVFDVFGRSENSTSYPLLTGIFAADDNARGLVSMKPTKELWGQLLVGAPVWCDAVSAFVGIVASSSKETLQAQCIPSRVLCTFHPELPVQFRIPENQRPIIKNLNTDDPNAELFSHESNNGERRLTAALEERSTDGYFTVRLTYEVLPNSQSPRGRYVTFLTYPDMAEYETVVKLDTNGKAVAVFRPFKPDFTVAVIADGGDTQLTLNLEQLQAAPQPSLYVSGPPGFSREFYAIGNDHEVNDQLDVGELANRLAELIALRETQLPLALGLFGNWGSGKSHFMSLMEQHLRYLADESKADWERRAQEPNAPVRLDPTNAGPWCREIVSVHFNAWHYVDSNLWASLVSQIFESLFTHLSPKQDELKKVQELLKKASGATARAAEELAVAKNETIKAKLELEAAITARETQETAISGMLFGLRKLLPNVQPDQVRKEIGLLLNDQKTVETIGQLQDVVSEAKTLSGHAQAVWNSFWKAPGLSWRLAWLAIVVAGTVYLPRLLVEKEIMNHEREFFVRIFTAIAGFLPALGLAIKRAKLLLQKVEDWAKQAKTAQIQARQTPQVKEAERKATAAAAEEDAARSRLAEAETRKKQLEAEERNLSPERRISRFIEQRAHSADYKGQLGLVSLARRDFEELSNLFADQEALRIRLAKLREEKNAENPEEIEKEAQELEALSHSIDRIILFVDDLDRCQPEKVVDVLQAVHLLLAFPLFSVVVGVDQRILRQSLRTQFRELLNPAAITESNDHHVVVDYEGESVATPLDYLEKIFHIPFHLPPIQKIGFSNLIENLTEARTEIAPFIPKATIPASAEHKPLAQELPPTEQASRPKTAGAPQIMNFAATSPDDAPLSQTTVERKQEAATGQTEVNPRPISRVIGSVPLERWERDALKDYYSLIHTPRGAKRLLNTYRLCRAGVVESEWKSFCGDRKQNGEFRLVMLFLAASAGSPAAVRGWFAVLRAGQFPPDEKAQEVLGHDWTIFKRHYDSTLTALSPRPTTERFSQWLNQVEQYTF